MNTLTISDIFSKLSDYQDQYLKIISNPTLYYTPVESAYLDIWPVGRIDLYLGDLLQLWFSERWLINTVCQQISDLSGVQAEYSLQRHHDLYLYQLSSTGWAGGNRSKVWSVSEAQTLNVSLDSTFKYYCIYKGAERPPIPKTA